MKLPQAIIRRLHARLQRVADRRPPDICIGGEADPYLRRWYLIPRNRWCNVYLHHFLRSDDDRALHDHPWHNCSILLEGAYREYLVQDAPVLRQAGDLAVRRPHTAHRVALLSPERRTDPESGEATRPQRETPCWTLFLTGPNVRAWGFLCPNGWRHWQDFTAGPKGEQIGRGCE